MKNLSHRERDAIELRNARRRRELDEKNTLWAAIIGRMRRIETWFVVILTLVVGYAIVLPVLQWVSKVFDTVSKVNGG
ncbi:MAG TPA: hypothetical protein PKV72_03315 [Candidatus Peribacteria bacterium]|nr:hypothetical protein [Candidatus Peribacteria bacterium]